MTRLLKYIGYFTLSLIMALTAVFTTNYSSIFYKQ